MSRNNQYLNDVKRLASCIERLTGIPAYRTLDHISEYGVNTILSGANDICTTNAQREKLTKIFAFKNLYETVKLGERDNKYLIRSVDDAKNYFISYFADIADREHIVAAYLNNDNKIITTKHITAGTIDSASIHQREIVKEALFCNAAGVIFAHNHPSGATNISDLDVHATNLLGVALAISGIRLLDHIIVGGDNAVSLSDEGHVKDFNDTIMSKAASPVSEKSETYKTKPMRIKDQLAIAEKQLNLEAKTTIPNHNKNHNHIER